MPARLSINLDNLKSNVINIKNYIGSSKVELLVMVKADAYGAGIVEVSKCLVKQGVRYLGVAYLVEAKKIFENNIDANVVIFSNLLEKEVEEAVRIGATLTLSDIKLAKKINKEAYKQGKKVKVHIKIDTGMTRLGVLKEDIEEFIKEIKKLKNLEIEGVFTHFSSADTDKEYTDMQLKTFKEVIEKILKSEIKPKYIHACNSAGVLLHIAEFCNMVRVGIAAYGYYPSELTSINPVSRFVDKLGIAIYKNDIDEQVKENLKQINNIKLKGIFKLEAPICSIRKVDKGVYVSYSKTYVTEKKSTIGTIQIGYADGLNRLLSNKYTTVVNGKNSNIIGNICMDMCMIDITNIDLVKASDMAVIFDYNDGKIDEIAKICNTINYEVITTIGTRVERVYIEKKNSK